MTISSLIQEFFDDHAKYFSHKMSLLMWLHEVSEAQDRSVAKIDLCLGVTLDDGCIHGIEDEDINNDEDLAPKLAEIEALQEDSSLKPYDSHFFLQVTLAETHEHPQKVVLLERVKGISDWFDVHSAIPIDVKQIEESTFFDFVCILKHGSHVKDVVYDAKVMETIEFEGGISAHEFVSLLHSFVESGRGYNQAKGVTCIEIAEEFAMGFMETFDNHRHHHHRRRAFD